MIQILNRAQVQAKRSLLTPYCILIQICFFLYGCGASPSHHSPLNLLKKQDTLTSLKVHVYLDLQARQGRRSEWLSLVFGEANRALSQLGVHLEWVTTEPWSTSDGEGGIALSRLTQRLSELKAHKINTDSQSKKASDTLNITLGINSYPPPSFAGLETLYRIQARESFIILRSLQHYYPTNLHWQISAEARLLTRSIAELLGAIPSCEGSWLTARRDQLLGWSPTRDFSRENIDREAPNRPTMYGNTANAPARLNPMHRRRAARTRARQDNLSEERVYFQPLSWSKVNVALVKSTLKSWRLIASSSRALLSARSDAICKQLQLIAPVNPTARCPLHKDRAQTLASLCYKEEDRLEAAIQNGKLEGSWWDSLRSLYQGLTALRNKKYEQAQALCTPYANQYPTSIGAFCLGMTYFQKGDYRQSIRHLRAYLSANVQDASARVILAKSLGKSGDDFGAIALLKDLLVQVEQRENLTKQLTSTPELINDVRINLGVAYARVNRYQDAQSIWQSIPKDSSHYQEAQALLERLADLAN